MYSPLYNIHVFVKNNLVGMYITKFSTSGNYNVLVIYIRSYTKQHPLCWYLNWEQCRSCEGFIFACPYLNENLDTCIWFIEKEKDIIVMAYWVSFCVSLATGINLTPRCTKIYVVYGFLFVLIQLILRRHSWKESTIFLSLKGCQMSTDYVSICVLTLLRIVIRATPLAR